MTLSRESVLALQRHFVGALRMPARTWLEPLPATRLAFTGNVVRRAATGCLLELGTVGACGVDRHNVRISHRGADRVEVRIADVPRWLQARWLDRQSDTVVLESGDAAETLEVTATQVADRELRGSLQLRVVADGGTERIEELQVRIAARPAEPLATFEFNGSPAPRPFDFGNSDTPYELTVTSTASAPTVVRCADLPDWMTFEVDGRRRSGPLPGRFFERNTPVTIRLYPHVPGRHEGSMRLETNDPRPHRRSLELRFQACLESAKPDVRAVSPPLSRLQRHRDAVVLARFENWGGVPARVLRRASATPSLRVAESFVIPAAREGKPGATMLGVRIVAAQLEAGSHTLPLVLHVADGAPAEVTLSIPVEIATAAGHARTLTAAVCMLVLIAAFLLFYFASGGTS